MADSGRVRYERWSLAWEAAGDGPVVALVHAPELGGSRQEWRELTSRLVDAGYRTIAVDLLGFGDSDRPARRYSGAEGPAQLEAFLAATAGGPAHLIARGHSVAYSAVLAAQRPERVRSLVAITPYGIHPTRVRDDVYRSFTQPLFGAWRHHRLTCKANLRAWLAEDVYFDVSRATGAELERLRQWCRSPGGRHATASLIAGDFALDARREWAAMSQPILLLWGLACDDPPFDDIEDYLAPLRPDAPVMMIGGRPVGVWKERIRYHSFPDTRQRPHIEAADAVAQVVLDHLRRVS